MPWLEIVHIVSAALWIGNFAVTGVWAARAYAARSRELLTFAVREILFTDAVFTLTFGAAVTISGVALARSEGIAVLSTFWTRTALVTAIGAGLVWLAILLPMEIAMYRRSKSGADLRGLFVGWNVLGWAVTIVLIGVIYLMVAKPV